jgi:hypothetical protein
VRVLFTNGMIAADFLGDPTGTGLDMPSQTHRASGGLTAGSLCIVILPPEMRHSRVAAGRPVWRMGGAAALFLSAFLTKTAVAGALDGELQPFTGPEAKAWLEPREKLNKDRKQQKTSVLLGTPENWLGLARA